MSELDLDFLGGSVRRRIIPVYAKTGQELHPLFTRTLWNAVRARVRQALRGKVKVNEEQVAVLSQLASGEYIDQNGVSCPVPSRMKMSAARMLSRLMRGAHV